MPVILLSFVTSDDCSVRRYIGSLLRLFESNDTNLFFGPAPTNSKLLLTKGSVFVFKFGVTSVSTATELPQPFVEVLMVLYLHLGRE